MLKFYEATVVGAGPVGLAFLAALVKSEFFQSSKLFLLVDQMQQPKSIDQQEVPRQRVIAVSQSTKKLMESVGAWERLHQNRVHPYKNMYVWETKGTGSMILNDKNKDLGYIIEYDNIVQSLMSVIQESKQVDIIQPAQLSDYKVNIDQVDLTIDQKQYQTRLLVGSDGNKSKVKEIRNIGTFGWSYNQMGIVATVYHSNQTQTAYQRYQRNGLPLALLPLWDNYSSIIWSCTLEDYQYLNKLSDEDFVDELNHAYQQKSVTQTPSFDFTGQQTRPPIIEKLVNKRMAFPFFSLQAQRYIDERIALIGDSAHSVHPQSGQGMNMGMNDAALLANCVLLNAKTGNDFGSSQALEEYEQRAKLMNYSTTIGNEVLMKAFSTNLITLFRNMGMSMLNNFEIFKQAGIEQANNHILSPQQYEWIK